MKTVIQFSIASAMLLLALVLGSCDTPTAPSGGLPTTIGREGQISSLKLKNKLYTDIVVRMEGPESKEIVVPARSSRSLKLKSGVYKYTAGASDFLPTTPQFKVLEDGRSYTMYF